MMDYFWHDNDNDTGNGDTNGEDNAVPVPLLPRVIPQINNDFTRPVFWYDAYSDNTGTLLIKVHISSSVI